MAMAPAVAAHESRDIGACSQSQSAADRTYGTHTTGGQRRATAVRSGNTSARCANSAGHKVHARKKSFVKRCVPARST